MFGDVTRTAFRRCFRRPCLSLQPPQPHRPRRNSAITSQLAWLCRAEEEASETETEEEASETEIMALLDGERVVASNGGRSAAAADRIICAADCDTIVEMESCSICLLEIEDEESAALRPCGHAFHQACIDQWLHSCAEVNSGRRLGRAGLLGTLSCPNCRQCPTLSDAEAHRLFPGTPGAPGTLERLDQAPTTSPQNAYLYDVVRRVQQANQTRDPSTGRIRFFRREDGFVTVAGKTVLYLLLFVPASSYFLVRRVLYPGARHFVCWLRKTIDNLPPPPDMCAITARAARAAHRAVHRGVIRPLGRAAAYTHRLIRRGARATKLYVYDGVLVPVSLAVRDQLLVPLWEACVWVACTTHYGAVWALRTGHDGGVSLLRMARDRIVLPARDGGVWLLRAARDRVLVPALPGEELVEIRLERHRRDQGDKC